MWKPADLSYLLAMVIKKILVTGSEGFVGKPLVSSLKLQGFQLLEADKSQGIDLTKPEDVAKLERFDLVFHLAALSYVPDSYQHPLNFFATNINSTLHLLELCRLNNARMVFASSYVYGHPKFLPINEEHPISAFNPYAQSKIIGEQLCESYFRYFKVPVTVVRPFNIYGPGQPESFLIPTIISQLKTGYVQLKDPRPKRDFIHLDDVIQAYSKMVYLIPEYGNHILNIGYGTSYSISEIIDILRPLAGKDLKVEYTHEIRENEVLDVVADISKAKNILNWSPIITLVEGIRNLYHESSLCL